MNDGAPTQDACKEERSADPLSLSFDALPAEMRVHAFGVDYGHLRPSDGGDLYVTRHGWPLRRQLQPENWYRDERYVREGRKLPGSTGHVYRLLTPPIDGERADLVIKFSRVAQEVPLVVETSFPDDVDPEIIASARFNSPMEEFGLVTELRSGVHGPRWPRMLVQRPLAIYVPPEEFQLWQLGRIRGRFLDHSQLLADDQENSPKAIELDIKRIYVLLYGWIKGADAEALFSENRIDEQEFLSLTPRVIEELRSRGFRVLDNKPKHFILRQSKQDGRVLRRHGDLVYGLVDFELLQRTPEYQKQFKTQQRERYWALQTQVKRGQSVLPSHLKPMRIFDVTYLYGLCPDGGRVWVIGKDPDLFDYFLPERWRRTPRVKLSARSEVYRTRTRDNIDVVYRRSRVGARPRVDPLHVRGRLIREHGYNSPFEEVAIAARLREMGIATTYPRAVCRTGHRTIQAAHLRDDRHFADHAHIETPDTPPEPVLSLEHDYYTIWDVFRGIDPQKEEGSRGRARGVWDLQRAHDDGLIGEAEYAATLERAATSLRQLGFPVTMLEADEFALSVGPDGPRRDDEGTLETSLCIDALTAYEYGLLNDSTYRALVERLAARLRAVDCEKLDLEGKHLLLSMNSDGKLQRDGTGEYAVTLCNFELIRGLYRPLH